MYCPDVSVQMPDELDLSALRGRGLQPGEAELPDAAAQCQYNYARFNRNIKWYLNSAGSEKKLCSLIIISLIIIIFIIISCFRLFAPNSAKTTSQ